MTIAAQLEAIRGALATWARGHGGAVEVADDPLDLLGKMQSGGQLRVVVLFREELLRGDIEESGFVDRTFLVVLSRGKGLPLQAGDSLVGTAVMGEAMYDLVEGARQVLRTLLFSTSTTEGRGQVRRIGMWEMVDALTDAYQIELTIGTQLAAAE